MAGPGSCVKIHGGVYRECVSPAFGGNGPEEMVCYEAYGDGEVIIKASEIADVFRRSEGWILFPSESAEKSPEKIQIWESCV